jgi:hypothetical protein
LSVPILAAGSILATTNILRGRRLSLSQEQIDEIDRKFFRETMYVLLFLLAVIVIGVSFTAYELERERSIPLMETTSKVKTVTFDRSGGSGNGKYKDKLVVRFENEFCFRLSFNRRDGDPIQSREFVVGDEYRLWAKKDRSEVQRYQLVKK